ncbi:MAG: peptidylprolyl isomerase [Anaerolineaceae bacterium]|nr:peptidylprolyl isomerase [Anaerolineaceae bacterium]MBN2678344.1 peptidylprolyl isomerase [Anaerolineaceae bacterium]
MAKHDQPKIVTKKHLARVERERRQNTWIVISASLILFAVVALIGYGVLDQTVLQMKKPVIQVGEDVINVKEYQKQVSLARAQKIMEYNFYYQFAQAYGTDQFQETLTNLQSELDSPITIGSQVLTNLTDDLLIRQEAARRGITVTDKEIDLKMQEMYNFYPNGTPTPSLTPTIYSTPTYSPTQLLWAATRAEPTATETATPEFTATVDLTPSATMEPTASFTPTSEFTPTVEPSPTATEVPATPTAPVPTSTATPEPTATPFTLEGYMEMMANYIKPYEAFDYHQEDYRRTVESTLYRTKLSEALAADVPHELEMVWARHILVGTLEEAEALLERIKNGEDFYDLAAEYSIDTSNNENGGDLGWFTKGMMVKNFENATYALSIGEISEPVATEFGFHIIQLLGKQTNPMSDYEWAGKLETILTEFLDKQKTERTDIETFDIWQKVVPSEPTIATFGTATN